MEKKYSKGLKENRFQNKYAVLFTPIAEKVVKIMRILYGACDYENLL